MNRRVRLALGGGVVLAVSLIATGATAGERDSRGDNTIRERLSGYEEDPAPVSTTGTGHFRARIGPAAGEISYSLSYSALESPVTQAHIHFGGRAQSGGIVVFLCSNLGNGPAGTQLCPAAPATIRGTIRPSDVVGPAAQGIEPGQFAEFVAAIRAGKTYVNVHSVKYPAGEIRAELEHGDHR